MPLRGGDAFLARDPSGEKHLWVIISGSGERPDDPALIVNLSTWHSGRDKACILEPGDHPFVKHKTYVNYRHARRTTTQKLEQALALGLFVPHHRVSAHVLRMMREGAAKSRFISLENLQLLRDQGLVE
jgi:hypothetical protein